jgi:hypothetical protein
MVEFRPFGSFIAKARNQEQFVVEMFLEVLKGSDNEGARRIILRTVSGQLLSRIEKGVYTIIGTGRILESSDPACL